MGTGFVKCKKPIASSDSMMKQMQWDAMVQYWTDWDPEFVTWSEIQNSGSGLRPEIHIWT